MIIIIRTSAGRVAPYDESRARYYIVVVTGARYFFVLFRRRKRDFLRRAKAGFP